MPPRCRGSRPQPSIDRGGPPLYEAAAVAPAGRRHRAWRGARMQNLFKPRFKLNAAATRRDHRCGRRSRRVRGARLGVELAPVRH